MKLKQIIIPLGLLLVTATRSLVSSRGPAFARSVAPLKIRNDSWGLGHYLAPRSGGRKHGGVDFLVYPGQPVYSPIRGKVTRLAYPYASDQSYKGIYIEGEGEHTGYAVKIFYMIPNSLGKRVAPGGLVGYAQEISRKYSPNMKDHIHVELYVNGQRQDPEIMI